MTRKQVETKLTAHNFVAEEVTEGVTAEDTAEDTVADLVEGPRRREVREGWLSLEVERGVMELC